MRPIVVLAAWLAVWPVARAADPEEPGQRDALALEQTLQRAIERAEPAIACVLVSRSDAYQRFFGDPAPKEGKLGDFDANRARNRLQDDEKLRKELEQQYRLARIQGVNLNRLFDLSERGYVPRAFGSGIVVERDGLILTSYHVIRDATKIYVRLPGGKGSYADIHAADPRSDLAILKLLDNNVLPLKPIPITQDNKFRKGQLVLSIANPYAAGFRDGSPSASWGIISNLRRRDPGKSLWEHERADWTIHDFGTMLQADPRLNLGCSGGALINLKGELIGITTALAAISGSETAGGYAVPLDGNVRAILNELIQGKEVAYGFLGVSFGRDDNQVEINVLKGSAAARGGLQTGDVILSVNGTPIRHSEDLFLNVGMQLAGTQAKIEVRTRLGVHRTLNVTLDKFRVPGPIIAAQRPGAVRGLRVEYASVWCQRFTKDEVPDGVYVNEVLPNSPAEQAKLQDHFITRVNGKIINSPADFYRETAKVNGPLTLTVRRSENDEYRTVRLD